MTEDGKAPAPRREVSNAAGSGFWLKAKPILVILARALKKKNFSADYKSHRIAMQRNFSVARGNFWEKKFLIGRNFFRARKKLFRLCGN
ncbi:MAG: hypothetical protein ACSLFE_00035 [Gemmatimonadaceae bacterium]